jgi:F-type H+-transporting ATPase subunit delta
MLHREDRCDSKIAILRGFSAHFVGLGNRNSPLDSRGLRRRLRDGLWLWVRVDKERDVADEQPLVSGAAGRYASALFELALEAKATDAVKTELEKFDALVTNNPDLDRMVRSPVFGADEQLRALGAILDKAGIKGLAANFLRVITTNRRLFAARDMIRAYRALVARHKGEITAQVTVAEKLSDKNLDALKGALKNVTGGKEIDFDVKVDPAIIGGLIVKVGSRMVDSSLRTKLNSIKIAMKEAR